MRGNGGGRPGFRGVALMALALFLPGAGRAFLELPEAPGPSAPAVLVPAQPDGAPTGEGGSRPVLVRKVEKVAFRAAASFESRLIQDREGLEGKPAEPVPPPRVDPSVELTKPDSLRLFLSGTPHNHRAPPV